MFTLSDSNVLTTIPLTSICFNQDRVIHQYHGFHTSLSPGLAWNIDSASIISLCSITLDYNFCCGSRYKVEAKSQPKNTAESTTISDCCLNSSRIWNNLRLNSSRGRSFIRNSNYNWRMGLNTTTDWHHRYQQQARWTSELRRFLYKEANAKEGNTLLDVGCGTGVLIAELELQGIQYCGLDIDHASLLFATRENGTQGLIQGDGLSIPLPDNSFDMSVCHFYLMWLSNPKLAVSEMIRVTKSGGKILALAEPDYGGRIDFPDNLSILGKLQTESLINQGANPHIGRRLAEIFNRNGLISVKTGVLGGQWSKMTDWEGWETEWQVLESDIVLNKSSLNMNTLSRLKEIDRSAYENGERILFVPTFYAWGIVK